MSLVLRGAAVACFCVAVAGCTTSVSPSGPSTGGATTPATSASASALAPTSASTVPTPTSATATKAASQPHSAPPPSASLAPPGGGGGGATGCATQDLAVKAGAAQGAAGSVYQYIDFTNTSAATCTLFGYPGVSLATGNPVTQVGAAAARSTATAATTVTLAAGQTANALLRITQETNYPAATCQPEATTYLQIYPPNQTTPIDLQYPSTGCASTAVNLLSIGVVQAGTG